MGITFALSIIKICWSQGKTKEEALKNIREAVELYLEPELSDLLEDENHQINDATI